MAKTSKGGGNWVIETLRSIEFGIDLLIAIAVVAVIGTILPQNQPLEFYREHYGGIINALITMFRFDITYRSPLFIGLLILFGVNLILCSLARFPGVLRRTFRPNRTPSPEDISAMPVHLSITGKPLIDIASAFIRAGMPVKTVGEHHLYGERGRVGYLGASLVHLSLLLFLAGGLTSLLTSHQGYIVLEPGQTVSEVQIFDGSTFPLGFAMTLDRFEVEFYEDFPNRPKSYTSRVSLTAPGEPEFTADIRVNHPLMRDGFTIYQSSYGMMDVPEVQDPDDRAVVEVSLKGAPGDIPPITTFEMVSGETYPIPGFGDSLSVTMTELYRNYQRVSMMTGELNPTVRLDVAVNGIPRWNVYAFERFPGVNMPMAPDLDLLFTLEEVIPAEGTGDAPERSGEYYTVLGVVRDRGVPVMWAASVIMIAGLVCSFYIRPRRVWVLEEGDRLLIGATTRGETDTLAALVKRVVGPPGTV